MNCTGNRSSVRDLSDVQKYLAGLGQERGKNELEPNEEVAPRPGFLADRHAFTSEASFVAGADNFRTRKP